MAKREILCGEQRRGRPKARIKSDYAEKATLENGVVNGETHKENPLNASVNQACKVLSYTGNKGKRVEIAYKREISPASSAIIQPLIDAAADLLDRKSEGYGHTAVAAIYDFANFLDNFEPSSGSRPRVVAQVNVFVGQAFKVWLIQKFPSRTVNNKYYHRIKKCFEHLRSTPEYNSREDIGQEPIQWPRGPQRTEKPLESLDDATFVGITRACQDDFDLFRRTFVRFAKNDERAKVLLPEDYCIENLMYFFKEECGGKFPRALKGKNSDAVKEQRNYKVLYHQLKKNGMSRKEFCDLYDRQGDELSKTGRSPKKTIINGCSEKEKNDLILSSIVLTLRELYPDWPLKMLPYDAQSLLSSNFKKASVNNSALHQAVLHCKSPVSGVTGVTGILDAIYPQSYMIWTMFIWCRIQSGWNSETLATLLFNDECIGDCPIDPDNYALIVGVKSRPSPKEIVHRSSKKDKYSMYSVLMWLKKTGLPLQEVSGSSSPWLFVHQVHQWGRFGVVGEIVGDDGMISSHRWIRAFFKRHEIYDAAGSRVESVNMSRLRTTYEDAKAIQWEGNLRAVSMDMSHADYETTERNYDSNSKSIARKDAAIYEVQKEVVEHVKHFKGTRMESHTRSELTEALQQKSTLKQARAKLGSNASNSDIVRIISPDAETYIAVCRNSKKPTWKGHGKFISNGEDCTYFNGCATCEQVVVFAGSLPFIAARILQLDDMRKIFSVEEWAFSFADEYEGWKELLAEWSDRSQVTNAQKSARNGEILIPVVMV